MFRRVLANPDEVMQAPMSVQIAGVDAQSPLGQALLELHQGPINHFRLAGRQNMLLSGNPGAMLQREVDGVQMRYGTQFGRETLQLRFSPAQIRLAEEIVRAQPRTRQVPDFMLDGYISVQPVNSTWEDVSIEVMLNGTLLGVATQNTATYIDIFSWWFGEDGPYLPSYVDTRPETPTSGPRLNLNAYNPNENQLWNDVEPPREDGYLAYLMPFVGSPDVSVFAANRMQNTYLPLSSPLEVSGHNTITVTAIGANNDMGYDDNITFRVGVHFFSRNPETFTSVKQGWRFQPDDVDLVQVNDHPIFIVWDVQLASGRTADLLFDLSDNAKAFPPVVTPMTVDFGGGPRTILDYEVSRYTYYDYVMDLHNDGDTLNVTERPNYYYPQ